MWLSTVYGFFSAVCAKDEKGNPIPELMNVRARDEDHLQLLAARFPEFLGKCEIKESEHTDYRFRIIVDKTTWASVAAALVFDEDYTNFKSAVMKKQGPTEYEAALHRMWSVMYATQTKKYGAGIYSKRAFHHEPLLEELENEENESEEQEPKVAFLSDAENDKRLRGHRR